MRVVWATQPSCTNSRVGATKMQYLQRFFIERGWHARLIIDAKKASITVKAHPRILANAGPWLRTRLSLGMEIFCEKETWWDRLLMRRSRVRVELRGFGRELRAVLLHAPVMGRSQGQDFPLRETKHLYYAGHKTL